MLNRRALVTALPAVLFLFFALPYYSRHSEDSERVAFRPFHPFPVAQLPQQDGAAPLDGLSHVQKPYLQGGVNPLAVSRLYALGIPSLHPSSSSSTTSSSASAGQTSDSSASATASRTVVPLIDPLSLYNTATTSTSSSTSTQTSTDSTSESLSESTSTTSTSETSTSETSTSTFDTSTSTSQFSASKTITESPSATSTSASSSETTTSSTAISDEHPPKFVTPHFDDTNIPHVLPTLSDSPAPQFVDDTKNEPAKLGSHPIDELIRKGKQDYAALKKKRVQSLDEAAKAYRERRGRHPPPNFDKWWEFSQQKGAIIIEDTFDQIYHDVEPFWGLEPLLIRETSKIWHEHITIRNGSANAHTEDTVSGAWLTDWTDMLRNLDGLLPDVDLAFNNIDESRIIVPWEKINEYMQAAARSRNTDSPSDSNKLVNSYQTLAPLPEDVYGERHEHPWEDWHDNTPSWNFTRLACPPDSEARKTDGALGDERSPFFPQTDVWPVGSHQGYVGNWTFARSACANPGLRDIHGNLIKPRWVSINQTLFPLFGGSKILGVNNEIIVPAAKYWSTEVEFTGESSLEDNTRPLWDMMINRAIWRGAASGGDHNESNWRRFHRQRFMSMMNGTQVTLTEQRLAVHKNGTDNMTDTAFYNLTTTDPGGLPHNFPLPDPHVYDLAALKTEPTTLGAWSGKLNDGAFTHLMCHPQHISQFGEGNLCFYCDEFYNATIKVEMQDQFMHKYLPDIDGNSYSGRYRAFLRSGSLPIKATIYTEWHDARLVPWVHFVPMDNSFADYWGILEYFAGYEKPQVDGHVYSSAANVSVPGHDDVAREIAMEGQRWANSMLRHEDMLVYVYRLILEYARVTNDERDRMGWAGDLEGQH